MLATVRRTLGNLNSSFGRLGLRLFPEAGGLITLVFHAILPTRQDFARTHLNPRYLNSLDQFEECVTYYLGQGYRAISPVDVLAGLQPGERYVLFTFDDGYANNLLVLPVLEKHRVPAVFALATDFVAQQKSFWWDILYQRRPTGEEGIVWLDTQTESLRQMPPGKIDDFIVQHFGANAVHDVPDECRPLRAEEVQALAKHPLIFWGNHTAGHEYLPALADEQARGTIAKAQEALARWTGARPKLIAYPYGGHCRRLHASCAGAGLELGFTTASFKQPLAGALTDTSALALPRFAIAHDHDIVEQCLETRIDWKPSWLLKGRPSRRAAQSP